MWFLHSYSLMPSWCTEDVVEMASMHAGYEADQCIATGASIKEVIILEPHVLLPITIILCFLSVEKGLIVCFFYSFQSTCRPCSLCV